MGLKSRSVTPRAAITDPEAIGGLLRAIDDFTGTYTVKARLEGYSPESSLVSVGSAAVAKTLSLTELE